MARCAGVSLITLLAGLGASPDAVAGQDINALESLTAANAATAYAAVDLAAGNNGGDGAGTGTSYGEQVQGISLTASPIAGWANQGRERGVDGYFSRSSGVSLGAGKSLDSTWKLGGNFTYMHTGIASAGSGSGNHTDINTYLAGLSLTYIGSPWFVGGSLTAGVNAAGSSRRLNTSNGRANADYLTGIFSANVNGGYPVVMGRTVLTPTAGLTVGSTSQQSYNESGPTGSTLHASALETTSVKGAIGGSLMQIMTADDITLMPSLRMAFNHEFVDGANISRVRYLNGSTDYTSATKPHANSATLGVGITGKLPDGLSLGANYSAEIRQAYVNNTFSALVKLDF